MAAPALSTLRPHELDSMLQELGQQPWRAAQLRHALWQPYVTGFDDIRQLPPDLRSELGTRVRFSSVRVLAAQEADGGRTTKLLCGLHDGLTVETVAMATPARGRSRARATVCVSTQVGCAVGCPFCATGRMGLRRNCDASEIVDQVRAAAQVLEERGHGGVTHVVYMGMGEPLANMDATLRSLDVLTGPAGLSARRITVSTSGIVPGIARLLGEAPAVTLAVSLHAATDDLRDRLVPLNRRYPIGALVEAAQRYVQHSGRRLTFEWCLIGGVNDSLDQARALRALAWQAHAHVNVIPMNRIDGSPWAPPPQRVSRAFLDELHGVRVTVRDKRGGDVDGACGQLRATLEARRQLRADGTLTPQRAAAVR